MAYNLEPRTIKENLLGLIGKNPHAEPRPANTREECFLADIAENGCGLPEVTSDDNGDVLAVVDGEWSKAPAPSSLPPYTSADKGKVLTVGEGEAEVVIPAQSLTIDSKGNGTLTGVDFSMLSDGDNVPTNIVVGGETSSITGTYVSEGSYVYYNMPNTPVAVIVYSDGRVFSIVMAGASGDISASVPSVEPKWEADEHKAELIVLDDDTFLGNMFSMLMATVGSATDDAIHMAKLENQSCSQSLFEALKRAVDLNGNAEFHAEYSGMEMNFIPVVTISHDESTSVTIELQFVMPVFNATMWCSLAGGFIASQSKSDPTSCTISIYTTAQAITLETYTP